MQARVGEPFHLVDVVVGSQLARSRLRKIGDLLPPLGDVFAQIERLTATVVGKRRVWLIADARLQAEFVNTLGDGVEGRIGRQLAPFGIEKTRPWHFLQRCGNQFVRSLQVVILQRRFIDLPGKGDFILGIGLRRIEMLGPVGKRCVENVVLGIGCRVRVVPCLAATGQQYDEGELNQGFPHGVKCNNLTASLPIAHNARKPDAKAKSCSIPKSPTSRCRPPATSNSACRRRPARSSSFISTPRTARRAAPPRRSSSATSTTALLRSTAVILGISRDSVKSHENFKAKQALPFELGADADETVCNLFAVMKMKNMYGKQHRGIERSTFVIDRDGFLRKEWRGVKVSGHAQEVLDFVTTL